MQVTMNKDDDLSCFHGQHHLLSNAFHPTVMRYGFSGMSIQIAGHDIYPDSCGHYPIH